MGFMFFLCGICVESTAVHTREEGKWQVRDVWHLSFILLVICVENNAWVETLNDTYSSALLRSLESHVWHASH